MTITIKSASLQHVSGIKEVIQQAFGDDVPRQQIEIGLSENTHKPFVALYQECVIGLVDCFPTTSLTGEKRLELDLLAVHPKYQGQGIGKRLITKVTQLTGNHTLIRALVASKNSAMQHTIPKIGFTSTYETQSLYISAEDAPSTPLPDDAHIIPVATLTYSGYWLEGIISQQAIQSACSQRTGDHIVGVVVPIVHQKAITILKAQGFEHIKDFHWWIKQV